MATRGIKKKDGEKLDDANILKVKELLEAEKPITKKEACQILNISYNSSRLQRIIDEYDERQERRKKNFAANRGRSLDVGEIKRIISWYLEGYEVSHLQEMLYRPASKIKWVLEHYGVPIRTRGEEARLISLIPEQARRETFDIGSFVWHAPHQAVCEVMKDYGVTKDGLSKVYQVYVYEKTEHARRGGRYDFVRAEDLGSLEHLNEFIDAEALIS
jgi:hypothetical protein